MSLRYNIEVVSDTLIAGWAWNSETDVAVDMTLLDFQDNTLFSVQCNLYREDLENAKIGNGCHAFAVEGDLTRLAKAVFFQGECEPFSVELRSGYLEYDFSNYDYDETKKVLEKLEASLPDLPGEELPDLLAPLPLDIFGQLLLGIPGEYPKTKEYFPVMAPEYIQNAWTGSSGITLLRSSCAFIRSLASLYAKHGHKSLFKSNVLDYGCGWGRLLRLLLKYVPASQLYAADAWEASIEEFNKYNMRILTKLVPEYPHEAPFTEIKMDLIYAFSVFTHTSEKCSTAIMSALRNQISEDGLLIFTTRPVSYGESHASKNIDKDIRDKLKSEHNSYGFAFLPHDRKPSIINGIQDIPFGDTSMTLDYIRRTWTEFSLVDTDANLIDPSQVVVALAPKHN